MKEAVVLLIKSAVEVLVGSLFAMLFLGAAHSTDHRVPAFGYETVIWLSLAAAGLVVAARQTQ